MRVLFLSPEDTLLLDLLAWLVIHPTIGYISSRLPISWFDPDKPFFLAHPWEKNGRIYQVFLRIRSWKGLVPRGGALYPDSFSLQRLPTVDLCYLNRWLRESCRAEFCHWLMILPGFLFFFWNSVFVSWIMVAYAVLNNVVPIAMQRFNRPASAA